MRILVTLSLWWVWSINFSAFTSISPSEYLADNPNRVWLPMLGLILHTFLSVGLTILMWENTFKQFLNWQKGTDSRGPSD